MTHGFGTYTSANGKFFFKKKQIMLKVLSNYSSFYKILFVTGSIGDVYVGTYENDKRNGRGVYTQKATGQVLDGEWVNGRMWSYQGCA